MTQARSGLPALPTGNTGCPGYLRSWPGSWVMPHLTVPDSCAQLEELLLVESRPAQHRPGPWEDFHGKSGF